MLGVCSAPRSPDGGHHAKLRRPFVRRTAFRRLCQRSGWKLGERDRRAGVLEGRRRRAAMLKDLERDTQAETGMTPQQQSQFMQQMMQGGGGMMGGRGRGMIRPINRPGIRICPGCDIPKAGGAERRAGTGARRRKVPLYDSTPQRQKPAGDELAPRPLKR